MLQISSERYDIGFILPYFALEIIFTGIQNLISSPSQNLILKMILLQKTDAFLRKTTAFRSGAIPTTSFRSGAIPNNVSVIEK